MTMVLQDTTDYRRTLDTAALWDEQTAGRIFMRGRDRAALLQRLSSNDIERLRPGQGATTVLTTPIGRIIDLLTIHALDDALLVVTSPGQGATVFSHLKKNIFFNDQVTLEPAGRSHAQLALFGPQAGAILTDQTGVQLADLAMYHSRSTLLNGVEVRIARRPAIADGGYTLYIPSEQAATMQAQLVAAGVTALESTTYEILRIEHGLPGFGSELSQEYIPLETGLIDAVSFSKGCYVGQEIIARMESRGRLAKQLRGLRLQINDEMALPSVPSKLSAAGKEAGDLTSVARSPRYGPIALGYVRSAHAEPGTQIMLQDGITIAEVVELPFAS